MVDRYILLSYSEERGCESNVRLPVKFPGCGQCEHACTVAIITKARVKKKETGLEKCMLLAIMDIRKHSR